MSCHLDFLKITSIINKYYLFNDILQIFVLDTISAYMVMRKTQWLIVEDRSQTDLKPAECL